MTFLTTRSGEEDAPALPRPSTPAASLLHPSPPPQEDPRPVPNPAPPPLRLPHPRPRAPGDARALARFARQSDCLTPRAGRPRGGWRSGPPAAPSCGPGPVRGCARLVRRSVTAGGVRSRRARRAKSAPHRGVLGAPRRALGECASSWRAIRKSRCLPHPPRSRPTCARLCAIPPNTSPETRQRPPHVMPPMMPKLLALPVRPAAGYEPSEPQGSEGSEQAAPGGEALPT